ncbi:MAG TPA: prepilin-type N-terminal cleavage/methylation domain-containing protein [Bryobacteraceae bacterium]|nr:prepilin-type N-terminal cleavage/methylation domain-containing protein [Bryobacteraceae bacterium]
MTSRSGEQGVTLIEMMVVTLLIALMAGISFPAVSSGVDSLRLNGAARNIATFFSSGLNRAERRQEAVEVVISPAENRLWMLSSQPGFRRELHLPDSVAIENILPPLEQPEEKPRSFFLYPGGTTPAMGITLKSRRGALRTVRVDPVTGVPSVAIPES